ncbi:hypothetical protein CspHIS471_0600220 [Cutaneotrichosporon sp. HIS471]|nr:hypothetical protein CspHIS471_0600220 [Cutaneotrichosporon sp. HIS471]
MVSNSAPVAQAFKDVGVSLNCDMGEGYYRWRLGPDEELFPLIDFANIACGMHAGDHATMLRMVRLAKEHGVGIGAHPGLDDIKGFGRRKLDITPEEVYSLALYQLGALKAMVDAEGATLSHVKPHGAFYFILRDDEAACRAFMKAHLSLTPNGPPLPYVGLAGTTHEKVCAELGIPFVPEIFVDIDYSTEKTLLSVPMSNPATVEGIGKKMTSILKDYTTIDKQGKPLELPETRGYYTVCLHSDMPTALDNARAARAAVDAAKK